MLGFFLLEVLCHTGLWKTLHLPLHAFSNWVELSKIIIWYLICIGDLCLQGFYEDFLVLHSFHSVSHIKKDVYLHIIYFCLLLISTMGGLTLAGLLVDPLLLQVMIMMPQ